MDSKDNDSGKKIDKLVTVEKNNNISSTPATSPVKVSSNTNINIGLDLLVNKEKKRPKKLVVNEQIEGFDLNTLPNNFDDYEPTNNTDIRSATNMEFLNNLNSSNNTNTNTSNLANKFEFNTDNNSRLNEIELENLVDQADQSGAFYNKDLRSNENRIDINNLDIESIRSTTSRRSKSSRRTRGSRRSKKQEIHGLNNNDDVGQFPHIIRENDVNVIKPDPINLEEIRKEKETLLCKFEKWRRLGVNTTKKYNFSSNIEEMRFEYTRIKHQRETESSVRFQKKMLMA